MVRKLGDGLNRIKINILPYVLVAGLIFGLNGCASGPWGDLKIVKDPTDEELRQNWNEYTVYYLRNLALVYKIKGDRKIILGDSWVEVSSEDRMAKSQIMSSTWVKEIIGNNKQLFGYLVHRAQDLPNVKIIDQNTVQIYYNRVAIGGR